MTTRDELLAMAEQAGAGSPAENSTLLTFSFTDLERFHALAVAPYKEDAAKAMQAAVAAIYFDDSSDFSAALWSVIRALGGDAAVEIIESDSHTAYQTYCERNSAAIDRARSAHE